MDSDVLIVGAGPTGLMLANQLARRGVRFRIIDRHSGPAQQTRALGVQARTMEIYAQLGIVDRAMELGKRATGADMWGQGRRMARIPLGDIGGSVTPYPYILILGQDDNERIMGDRLRELGADIEWETELVDLRQGADRVRATLKKRDGATLELSAAWVAGCDGAHSAVRELNGIAFPGAPYEHVFFVADVEATGGMVADELNIYFWRDGFHLMFPMRGKDHWRIVGILPAALRGRPDIGIEDVKPSLLNEAGADLAIRSCSWFSTYRIHHRAAARFQDRRCFVLGDAAHIHSPVGAQGMNTGLQDAYNLAWKMALVVSGRADATLLASYEQERIPVARRLLETTDRAFRLVVSDSWLAGLMRTKVIARIAAAAMSSRKVRAYAFRTVSQTGIRYRNSQLSRSLPGLSGNGPRAGDRFPWLHLKLSPNGAVEDLFQAFDDLHFHLVVIGQPAPDGTTLGMGEICRVHAVPTDAGNDAELGRAAIPQPSFYLVRPDGHIGLAGARLEPEAIRRYLFECLHLRA